MSTTVLFALSIYLLLLVCNIVSLATGKVKLAGISKVLLMPSLAFFYYAGASTHAWAVLLALFFSWLGDIALLQSKFPFLLAGIAGFALAHMAYLQHMSSLLLHNPPDFVVLLVAGVVYFVYALVLSSYLKDKTSSILKKANFAIPLYAGLLATMSIFAVLLGLALKNTAGYLLIVGANLFLISDSILAFHIFVKPSKTKDVLIMLSYGLAQLCLVAGFGLL